jgi:hypothetical protein
VAARRRSRPRSTATLTLNRADETALSSTATADGLGGVRRGRSPAKAGIVATAMSNLGLERFLGGLASRL